MSQHFENIWDAIEDTPAQAENMKVRSSLMIALKDRIEAQDLSQADAAKLFGVTQPRISDLMRGKITLFSIDTLINMLACAGLHIELTIAQAA
ncbi:XRE family transcriptional regulator (plasmid) [Pseudomonas yamanorum]|nr:XRE family transcriptional regulator [Pseudomonas yamanorum]